MMHGFDYSDYETEAFELLPGAADHILGQKEGQKRFADCITAMSQAFALCSTYEDAIPYREEVAFLQAIKTVITKHSTASIKLKEEQQEYALRQIVSKAIVADGVVDIFAAAGLENPNIGLLSD
jgi:type I restriction enzyme R subunit